MKARYGRRSWRGSNPRRPPPREQGMSALTTRPRAVMLGPSSLCFEACKHQGCVNTKDAFPRAPNSRNGKNVFWILKCHWHAASCTGDLQPQCSGGELRIVCDLIRYIWKCTDSMRSCQLLGNDLNCQILKKSVVA